MVNNLILKDSLPVVFLKIAALEGRRGLVAKVNSRIVQFRRNDIEELMYRKENLHYRRYDAGSYLLHCSYPRFGTSEDKAVINKSAKGADVFVMVGMIDYSIPYTVSDYTNHMPPGDHFQDLKWTIRACSAAAYRTNVVILLLYESRQHKRDKRGSLDCATALRELATLGMKDITTFDTHDPRVQSAIPLTGFDSFMPTYQFIKALFSHDSNTRIDKEHLMVVSPDEGATNRVVYLTNNLGVDMGMSYKRKDYSQVIDDRNPVVAYELLGSSVEGKTILIIDDMISSGEGMLDTCKKSKEHKADEVIIRCTFGFFTNGLERFDKYHHQGYLDYVITTNLNYRTQELLSREWYLEADMSKYPATVINSLGRDCSISTSLSLTEKTQKLAQKHRNDGYEYFQKLA